MEGVADALQLEGFARIEQMLEKQGAVNPKGAALDLLLATHFGSGKPPHVALARGLKAAAGAPEATQLLRKWLATLATPAGNGVFGGTEGTRLLPFLGSDELLQMLETQLGDDDQPVATASLLSAALAPLVGKGVETAPWDEVCRTVMQFARFPKLVAALARSPRWLCRDLDGAQFQQETVLGPLLSLGAEPVMPGQQQKQANGESLGRASGFLHERLHSIAKDLFLTQKVDAWPTLRPAMMDFFAAVLNANAELSKEMPNRRRVSHFSMMYNVLNTLLRLMEPVYNRPALMVQLRPSYVASPRSRIRYDNITRLAADAKEVEAFSEEDSDAKDFSFVCETFFFCAHAVHLTVSGGIKHCRHAHQDPMAGLLGAAQVQQTALQLVEPRFVDMLLSFFEFQQFWLQWIARRRESFGDASWRTHLFDCVPQKEDPPKEWTVIPEYFIQDVRDTFTWWLPEIAQRGSRRLDLLNRLYGAQLSKPRQTMSMCVHMMANDRYITSPYIRAGLPEMLALVLTMDQKLEEAGAFKAGFYPLFPGMLDHPLARRYLVPHAMKTYVDVENLGGSDQFFEKFQYRRYLSELIKELWRHADYREALRRCAVSKDGQDSADNLTFVKFFNMMLNDTTYLLSESLENVRKLHTVETAQDSADYKSLPQSERDAFASTARDATRQLRPYLSFANDSVELMYSLGREVPEAFLHRALVQRLTSMLNLFLIDLTKDAQKLKLRKPAEHLFDHSKLLLTIVLCFNAFARRGVRGRELFLQHVSEDPRSYSAAKFRDACEFVSAKRKFIRISDADVQLFCEICDELAQLDQEGDIPTELVPEELLDPILAELMTDPVQLPETNRWVQRSVIEQHLLSAEFNPFTRAPLSMQQLEEHNRQPDIAAEAAGRAARAREWRASFLKKAAEKS
eukprot:TRINITY_DN42955_c0_g1_i1.p1 TRINITY_DN42955_c0_g1~~TRINITY_DN42955_c0_g1_i1.p1  ORF type:complete len:928 (+),score=358.66 TRINITY_DN42955_c0_g1_i1:55-2784(+)